MPALHLTGKTIAALPVRTPIIDEHGNLARPWIIFFESLLPTGPITLAYPLTERAGVINIQQDDPGPLKEIGRLSFATTDPTQPNVAYIRVVEGASRDEASLEFYTSVTGAPAVLRLTIAKDGSVIIAGALAVTGNVNITGNLATIQAVPYTWPVAQGVVDSFLRNSSTGVLSWVVALIAANNLSDLTNTATARTNLNVPTKISGTAGNIVLAKLTPGGSNGQITVNTDGLISSWIGPS